LLNDPLTRDKLGVLNPNRAAHRIDVFSARLPELLKLLQTDISNTESLMLAEMVRDCDFFFFFFFFFFIYVDLTSKIDLMS